MGFAYHRPCDWVLMAFPKSHEEQLTLYTNGCLTESTRSHVAGKNTGGNGAGNLYDGKLNLYTRP